MDARPAVLGLVTVLALGACGGTGKDSPTSASRENRPAAQRGERPDAAATGGGAGKVVPAAGTGPGALAQEAAVARSLIRTATMTVRVRAVEPAAAAATAAAERAGGFLEGESSRLDEATTLTLRVPPARFSAFLDEAAKLGTVAERQVGTEDVTGTVADVEGRLAAARASTRRLRTLMARAGSVSSIADVERELSNRESDIESLEGRLRSITDETSFATVTLTLEKPRPPVAAHAHVGGFIGGLRVGWAAFTGLLSALLVTFGVLLPFAVTGAVVVLPIVLYLRRKRGRYSASTP